MIHDRCVKCGKYEDEVYCDWLTDQLLKLWYFYDKCIEYYDKTRWNRHYSENAEKYYYEIIIQHAREKMPKEIL